MTGYFRNNVGSSFSLFKKIGEGSTINFMNSILANSFVNTRMFDAFSQKGIKHINYEMEFM